MSKQVYDKQIKHNKKESYKNETITLSDEIVRDLERLSNQFGISIEKIIKRGMTEYLRELKIDTDLEFEAIVFGMWAERTDMKNSAQWVRKLREQEWNRS